ncbi:hypothetical protein [Crenalkalicoccus roseus]|uniref:hypothetical protein n=1 Tax=Crenalkalicoccus roseus TaxID=1485588 RepID=UPI0010806671|nr:hypothetical protein [Crenalkalicoccus roseus]
MHAPTRRALLATPIAAAWLARPAAALLPGAATLLVPGPAEGSLSAWTRRLAEALAQGAGTAVRLERSVLGGPDGVTAANRFATAAGPDGRSLLVLTGAAAQARLVGDPRARFDPRGWLPVCAMQAPVLVAGRAAMPRPGGRPLRLGLGAAEAPGSAALLALDLLGIAATPVLGLGPAEAEAALRQGAVEAIVLQGPGALARLRTLGAEAWFRLDALAVPEAAAMPLPEPLSGAPAPLLAALRAAGACAGLPACLVLPALTPADLVALWRGAARRWLEEEGRHTPEGVRLLPGVEAMPWLAALAPSPEASLAYREWLLRRLRWHPG